MKNFNLVILAFLVLFSAVSLLEADVVVRAGYENGLENSGNSDIGVVEPAADRIEASQDYARFGSWSVRTELRYGDTTPVGVRAESNIRYSGTEPIIERGVNKFYGFSLLIDPTAGNFDYDSNGDILFQSKQTDSNPHFHIMTDEGQFKYVHKSITQSKTEAYFGTYQKGIWYDFVVDHLPAYDSNGHLKLYFKKATDSSYTKVLDYSGATLLWDKDGYAKWGIYKGTWANSPTDSTIRVVYHDNITVATSFAEIEPSAEVLDGDLNGDDTVNMLDLAIMMENWLVTK